MTLTSSWLGDTRAFLLELSKTCGRLNVIGGGTIIAKFAGCTDTGTGANNGAGSCVCPDAGARIGAGAVKSSMRQ